ncbi:MAG: glucosamine-6-phosphate deaminase [Saprospiraceae bacterium]|nr:glucosamine-6-phosphate deaminase [Saprospiraceae bacterium]HRD82808.1 glucosamine-6-phosphate deaminase [Saprospiraceae bacterium]
MHNATATLKYQLKSLEKIPVKIWDDPKAGSLHLARSIALAIRQKQQDGEKIVLGLATGSSPIQVYAELVRLHKEEGLSFRNVVSFNLDEYYPMQPEAQQSYVHFMKEYLFDHVDIDPKNIHIPDGAVPMDDVEAYCERYEKMIDDHGGIDIQLLGIGRTGHIGFNEPGSWEDSKTRLVRLDGITRRDAVKDFNREEEVPYRAITMGIGSIMKARSIYLMAWGSHKAQILKEAVEGPITPSVPATFLQKHPNVKVYADIAACEELTRIKTPWLVGMCNWNEDLVCKAVVWLSLKTGKPILKLTDEDYSENQLSDLTIEYDDAYNINIRIFNRLQHTITGWPGGKPNADDSHRPERAKPAKKRVIIFSPHPDDDVISMGGTFLRLVEQGHDVHVAYQTSGNIAVHDHDAMRFMEFVQEYAAATGIANDTLSTVYQKVMDSLAQKQTKENDIDEVRKIKGFIRRGEARAGARFCGLPDDHIHFLDMPFYETGRTRKKPIGEDDVRIIMELMEKVKPHQIYAAGDLADPHGTHRVCLDAIFGAFRQLQERAWMKDCWLWLYRGAWHEWSVDEIEMAVPISPKQLERKRKAIFMHQSQKDKPPFPGSDDREFWQRAEQRNRETARLYRSLGLAEYEAMEAFRRWKF